ncbi:MAG: hypothetical protein ABII00_10730 [Elusimicrobiota bacterium]
MDHSRYLCANEAKVSRLLLRTSRNLPSAIWSLRLASTARASFLLGPTFSRTRLPLTR